MEQKHIEFSVNADIHYPRLYGDEKRIEQVLLKLLDNAWKYTSEGGRVTVEAEQSLCGDGRISTKISVTDTGCGMSREFQRKIFDSFTQERKTVSKGNQGTGLGMSISHQLAKLMSGYLTVESELGKGSCFTFLFVTEKQEHIMPETEDSDEISENDPSEEGVSVKKKVLVAEDNELNAEILMELLSEGGYESIHARDGQETMDIFSSSSEGEIGVILMDLMMPVKDGFEAARGIRRMKRSDAGKVKIIACTANTMKEDRKKAQESGMDDFISKPVDIGELFRKIEN